MLGREAAICLLAVCAAVAQPAGEIQGLVLDADSGGPVSKVQLTLVPRDTRQARPMAARSDERGWFRFEAVAPGEYTIMAARTGYVPQDSREQNPVTVSGRRSEGVVVQMQRGAVIAGRVVDEAGEPVAGLIVMAVERPDSGARPRRVAYQRAITNDLGEYRLHGLAPSNYQVVVEPNSARSDLLQPDYLRALYPVTGEGSEAAPLSLRAGEEHAAADIRLRVRREARRGGPEVERPDQPQPGAVAAAGVPARGSGGVSGTVLDAVTGAPLVNAQVVLRAEDSAARAAQTDGSGAFAFDGVDAGRYRVAVRKNGYVEQVYEEEVADGKRITLRLRPTAVINGRVLDEDGDPLEGVEVMALRYAFVDGRRQLAASGERAETDDRGEYRVHGLRPGAHYIGGRHQMRVGFLYGVPGVSVYRPLFYPGVPEASQAAAILLRPGEERGGVDLQLAPEPAFEVRGHILDGRTGEPVARATLSVLPEATASVPLYSQTIRAVSAGSGEFRVAGLTRGDYTLEVITEGEGDARQYAATRLRVTDSDVENLEVTVEPPVTVSGVVKIEGASTLPAGLGEMQVILTPGTASMQLALGGAGMVEADGSFEISNVPPAPYRLEVYGIPEQYYLAAARYGDSDALENGVSIRAGAPLAVEITLSPRAAQVTGLVEDARGDPLAGATVLLIPRREGPSQPQLYKRANSDDSGRFRIGGVTPGNYTALALDNAPFGVERDPMLAELHRNRAVSLSLDEGEQQSIELRVARHEGR